MYTELRPIYTESENCQDCYKCIRECPVKAIRIENNKAFILEERCVYCGHCTQVCPTGAKKIRDGVSRVRLTLQNHPKVILSLAPSYISEFGDIPAPQLIAALRRLGFTAVSETALGAELVSEKVNHYLSDSVPGVYISSACPVVIEYIRKYSPEHITAITPIFSPMLAHASMLKAQYGDDVKIVFAGPCICKKLEADNHRNLVEVAITFRDLLYWFDNEGIILKDQPYGPEDQFVPFEAGIGSLYPIEGGMLPGLDSDQKIVRMAFSGFGNIKGVIKNLPTHREKDSLFLELLACKGGCINGPALISQESLALKRYAILSRQADRIPHTGKWVTTPAIDTIYTPSPLPSHPYPEEEITQALAAAGKILPKDELNCSGCGYDSCRDFAIAMLEGRAEENMCVSYMRKIAHDKATVLLQKIPEGVLLVDADLKIADMNQYCADLLGEETRTIYDITPGLQGVDLKKICSFSDLFAGVLESGLEINERQIKEADRVWLLSIYNIQPRHLVFGLLRDLREPYVRQEWMIGKIQETIRKHMSTVQQVACLLGENAAFSDAALRAVTEVMTHSETEENPITGHKAE